MKVVFVQLKPECSLGSMYIASAIKEEAECRVFIRDYEDDIYTSIANYNPDMLAFSTFTGEYKELLAINKEIKKRVNAFSVFGGPHPTYNPDTINYEGVDAICRGEGELGMLELVHAFYKKTPYDEIKNFFFKTKNGEIIKNEVRKLK